MKTILLSIGLTLVIWAPGFSQQATAVTRQQPIVRAENYYRTELYMGRSVPGGGMVSDESWEKFLSDVVTPQFPDGFTVLTARGQYREASGTIAKEPSHVLIFLYKKADRRSAEVRIERIRGEYKKLFAQESVLRVDFITRKALRVSF